MTLGRFEGSSMFYLDCVEDYAELLGGKLKKGTDQRIVRFSQELKAKRDYEKFTTFDSQIDEMIIVNGIRVFSFCEHHLLPYYGVCSIGYIPQGKILGLSKFQRLVDKLASRPTVQEELTVRIINWLDAKLKAKGFGCVMKCWHTCAVGRGIENPAQTMNTQVVRGIFKESEAKDEFMRRVEL